MRRNPARGRRCFCFTRCCRTGRVSTPSRRNCARSFRVIVPELPGFGGSQAVERRARRGRRPDGGGGERGAAASEAIVLGNGYGGFVALQMAIRHPGIAQQTHSRRLRRGVLGTRPRGLPQHGGGIQSQGARRDHRCRDAPAVRAGVSGSTSRSDARPPRGVSENRSGSVSGGLRRSSPRSICGPSCRRSKCRCWCWSANMTRRRRRRCRMNWRRCCRMRG